MRTASIHRVSLIAAAASAAVLCGCTILVKEPERPALGKVKNGISYDDAFTFLRSAQQQVRDGQDQVDQLSQGTVGAVGVGTGGAALATLAHTHRDVPLGLLALASMTYTVNQVSGLKTQSAIYGATRKRLDCIEQAGYSLYQATGDRRAPLVVQKNRLAAVLSQLDTDIDIARSTPSMTAAVRDLITQAETARLNGRKVENSITAFLLASDVGQQMYSATVETLRVANEQLRANSADAAAAATSGTVLKDFATEHSKLLTAAGAAAAAASTPSAVTQGEDVVAVQLRADLAELYRVVTLAKTLIPASTAIPSITVASCLSSFAPQGNVILEPNDALNLTIGGDSLGFLAYTEARQQLAYDFLGATPQAKDLSVSNQGGSKFSVAAPPGSKAGQYTLYFYRTDDKDKIPLKPTLQVNVGNPPAPAAAPAPTPSSVPAPTPSPAPDKLTFGQRRSLLGLDASISAETDPKWIARVQKLNASCFNRAAGKGVLDAQLIADLRKSEAVNSAGDCPKPKAAASPTSPGASAPATPIPAPPPIVVGGATRAASAASK